ncbi:MAG: DNA/RNA non-specific endonuclease [Bacteroidales bacterium]|nr:DNA/RNA non-specific endonuclease [Bacteroidales bacterium]
MSSTGATLSGSFSGATGSTRNWGFQYGTSSSDLSNRVYAEGLESGSAFTFDLGSLAPNTTYYYRAIIEEFDESQGKYIDRVSSTIKSFKTLPIGDDGTTIAAFGKGWAELPLATTNSSLTENETQCVKYITDMAKQSNGSYHRNYSFCYDTEHYVAMWVAYPMHKFYTSGSYESETFKTDPSFTPDQQLGSTYNSSTYDRGHQIAKPRGRYQALRAVRPITLPI